MKYLSLLKWYRKLWRSPNTYGKCWWLDITPAQAEALCGV